jgi:1-phosphofructokinase
MKLGTINRVSEKLINAGGKGINQSVLFANLGIKTDCYFFSGGAEGLFIEDFLKSKNVNCICAKTQSGVRQNIKIIDQNGVDTEINESGGPFSKDELDKLTAPLIENDYDIVSLCGSIPQGVEKCVYNSIIKAFKGTKTRVFLDCDGDALRYGYAAKPYLIKPNKRELCELLGFYEKNTTTEEIILSCGKILSQNTTYDNSEDLNIICTLGENGSLYFGNEGSYRVGTVKSQLKGFAGAGDSYLAAFIWARFCDGRTLCESLRFAAAASAAKISLKGTQMPKRADIDALLSSIDVSKM